MTQNAGRKDKEPSVVGGSMCLVRLEDDLEALFMERWRRMRRRNRQANVTHYELTFVINEDAADVHVRNIQKDIAVGNPTTVTDALTALGVDPRPVTR